MLPNPVVSRSKKTMVLSYGICRIEKDTFQKSADSYTLHVCQVWQCIHIFLTVLALVIKTRKLKARLVHSSCEQSWWTESDHSPWTVGLLSAESCDRCEVRCEVSCGNFRSLHISAHPGGRTGDSLPPHFKTYQTVNCTFILAEEKHQIYFFFLLSWITPHWALPLLSSCTNRARAVWGRNFFAVLRCWFHFWPAKQRKWRLLLWWLSRGKPATMKPTRAQC